MSSTSTFAPAVSADSCPTPALQRCLTARESASFTSNSRLPLSVLASTALVACGGGGSADSPTPGSVPAATPAPSPVLAPAAAPASAPADPSAIAPAPAPAPAPAVVPASPSSAEAARLLAQAGFAATVADIEAVKRTGYSSWLDEQFTIAPTVSHFEWLVGKGYAVDANKYNFNGLDNTLWRKLLSSPDALRQRVVLALSEIFVTAMGGIAVPWGSFAAAAYVDMLEQRAFSTFRELLEGVSLSCCMGVYLNMRGNKKEDSKTGSTPDENYAREVMQLMTIGLYELQLDGTPVLDANGKVKETYTQDSITELARVFTGWDFDTTIVTGSDPSYMKRPMVNTAGRFSTGAKKVLDVAIPASADGPTAMRMALDTLANHPNVGPFIGRQLIQRLVCSNPSPAYVKRVATVFNNNGAGQRGDLKAVIKAILLDEEARGVSTGLGSGRLREPIQRFVQWGRTFGAASATDLWNVGDTSNPANRLGQSPLRSPSVFNFFRPGYVPPNSVLGSNKITAPEFQLCNESTVAGYLNFMQSVIASGVGEVKPNYTAELAIATDAPALVARVALLLAADGLSAATTTKIANAVGAIKADTDAGKLNRVQASILLVMASPEYLIQK